jgi:signal transduction histidine kinase
METDLSPEQLEYLRDMECSCLQMRLVVSEVLECHKLQAGRIELEALDFSPESVLSASISQVKAAAVTKGISLRASVAADVPKVLHGDPSRVTQMLVNYLSNAIKVRCAGSQGAFTHPLVFAFRCGCGC